MELRSVALQDADQQATFGYSLQGYINLGTTFTLLPIGSFPDLASSAAAGTFIAGASGGHITYNATNHDPFSV